ncbi:MAG: hypothetical protein KatS3mg027_0774 [Bacteroidia bacterium]|nr:MAG: hypothetical protein KatS3mg027_0774 [Bacteroidia bacterium]
MTKESCTRLFADETIIKECKKTIQKNENVFQQLSRIFSLAGSDVRLKILYLLEEEGELCPCDLSDILNMSIPAVSQHLRKLKDAGIITNRRSGQTIYYSLVKENEKLLRPLFKSIHQLKKQEVL